MDSFLQVDVPVFSRFVFCFRQREALKLAAVSSAWPELVTTHYRKLLITAATPMSVASATADNFHRLREVVVDGERKGMRECAFWEAAAALVGRLLKKPLETLIVRSLPLDGSLAERRVQMHFLQVMLEALPSCPSLQYLGFDNVPLATEEGAWQWLGSAFQTLSAASALTRLSFTNCALGVKGVEACLAIGDGHTLEKIQELDLSNNLLGEEGAVFLGATLPKLCKLRVLKLAGNGMGPTGAQALQAGLLAVSPTLQHLDMSANGLCSEGVAALVLASLKLQSLSLAGSWLTADGVNTLLQLLQPMAPHLTHLDIAQNRLNADGTRSLLEQLPVMPHLRSFNFAENFFATQNVSFNRLTECAPVLEDLNLKASSLGSDDVVLSEVAACLPAGLVSLHLSVAQLKAPQLQILLDALPTMQKLERLSLCGARLDDGAADLLSSKLASEKLPQLQHLDLSGNAITAPALNRLAEAMQRSSSLKKVKVTGRQNLLFGKRRF